MTQPQYAALVEHIEERTPLWQTRLGLDHFDVETVFVEAYATDDDASLSCAEALTEWQYLRATIKWYLPAAAALSLGEIEKRLVHELTHVLLCPTQDVTPSKYDQQVELATEMTARALYKAYA